MSETEALGVEGEPAEIDLPEDGEQVVEAPEPEDVQEPAYDLLEVDDPDAVHVPVTVDGQERVVPLSEALRGYVGNESSTQRYQQASELASQATEAMQIQQALETDPGLAVQVLASRAGMSVDEYLGWGQQQEPEPEPEFVDPLERELYEEKQARLALEQRIDQREQDQALQQTIYGLKQQFGATDDDIRATVNYAYQGGYGLEALPTIHKALMFDKFQTLAQQRAQQQKQQDAQRKGAAKASTSVVSQGSGAANTTAANPAASQQMSFAEAFDSAWEQISD